MTRATEKTPEQIEADRIFMEKVRSVGVMTKRTSHGWSQVREFRNEASGVVRKTLDEGGNVVTEHSKTDRQDVHINAKTVTTQSGS